MRSKLLINLILLPSFISISSCSPFVEKEEQDYTKLYVGGYKTVLATAQENEEAKCYSNFIYLKFCLQNEIFEEENKFTYDLEIDLNSSELENLSTEDNCGFYEVGQKFKTIKSFSSYSSIDKFISDKNYISLFTSIGKYSERNRIVSRKFKITHSGYAYAFSSISSDLEKLNVNYVPIYASKLYLFDTFSF